MVTYQVSELDLEKKMAGIALEELEKRFPNGLINPDIHKVATLLDARFKNVLMKLSVDSTVSLLQVLDLPGDNQFLEFVREPSPEVIPGDTDEDDFWAPFVSATLTTDQTNENIVECPR